MEPDDEVCLCFHVTLRKLLSFLRVEKPRRASQLSECGGAGTGCGWCRPFLEQLFEQAAGRASRGEHFPVAADYAQQRLQYVQQGGGTPPPGDSTPADFPAGSSSPGEESTADPPAGREPRL